MKRYIITLISIFSINILIAQITLDWETKYNGASSFLDYAGDIAVDNNNNVYITGNTFVNNTTNGYDTIVVKYDEFGNETWRSSYSNGSKNDKGVSIMIINNSIYVISTYWNKLIILNFSVDGTLLWENEIETIGNSHDVKAIRNNGFIYLKQRYYYNYDYEYKSRVYKIDLLGNLLWTFDSQENTSFLDMEINSNGDLLIVGVENEYYDYINNINVGDALIIKIDKDTGTLIWHESIDLGYEYYDTFKQLTIDEADNIYTLFGYNTIYKYDNNGTKIWNESFIHPEYGTPSIHGVKYDNNKLYLNGYNYISQKPNILTVCFDTDSNLIWYNSYFTNPNYSAYYTFLDIDNNHNVFSFGYRQDVIERKDVFFTSHSSEGLFLTSNSYNSTGNSSESVEKTLMIGNYFYILAESNDDIMTMKFLNPYALSTAELDFYSINVYPNPFNNNLHINLSELKDVGVSEIKIFNTLGELVYSTTTIKDIVIRPDLHPGVYFMKILNKGKIVLNQKIIKTI